ncbi:MAG: hypothetical protein FJ144_24380 [Deltaproteobacteria bacterium]|nr:hypothetical protein [Deltaproteobacteria bacterium]
MGNIGHPGNLPQAEAFVTCGDFGRGFLLAACRRCGEQLRVPFSCKGRGHPQASRSANQRRLRRLLAVSSREGARAEPRVTLRRQRRAQPAASIAPALAIGQVIETPPVGSVVKLVEK